MMMVREIKLSNHEYSSMVNALIGQSPYGHELNADGDACGPDCGACRWAKEHQKEAQ
jgi:hypothetical protein